MFNIYNRIIYTLLSIFAIFLTWGCNIVNPTEKVPTYVHIDSFLFQEPELHDISCIWVYYNNNPVGAFDLPATVPIITSGSGRLEIKPGINVNGRNERPLNYPFYTIDTSTLAEQPGTIINYVPKTRYFAATKRTMISDFEAGITKFAQWGGTTSIIATTDDSLTYEGTGSGGIFLNAPNDTSSIDSTTIAFQIPPGVAFIELTYKSTIPFALGMQAYLGSSGNYSSNQTYLAGVNPSDTWRKFYFNLTGFTTQYPADEYNLFIKTSLPSGQTSGRILIDNVKLVTY